MARPRKSHDSREALLAEGLRLVTSQGYHGTGIKEILDAVSVPKGSFYNYFASKEAFVAAIIDSYVDTLLHRFDKVIARSQEDALTLLKGVYGYMLKEMASGGAIQGCLVGNLAAEVGGSSPLCQEALRRGFARWRERVVALFERGQAEGCVRRDIDADVMAGVFWNAWEGGLLRMKLDGDPAPAQQTLHLLLERLYAAAPAT